MINSVLLNRTGLVLVLLGATMFASPAMSQDLAIEEIVVTATKRQASLQDVPIAVSVVGAEQIAEQSMGSLEEVATFIPNVNITETSGNDALFIRGIGSPGNAGFEQSVGTFVDGVYRGRSQSSRAALLDVARVEVLKGPQSTLFGKNTIAGALNITTAGPTEEFEGSITATAEPDFGGWGTTAVFSGPVSDTLGARLAIRHEESDGYFNNRSLNRDERQEKDTVGRLTLDWQATEDLKLNLKLEHGETDTIGRQNTIGIATPTASFIYRAFGDPNFQPGIGFDKYSTGPLPGRDTEFDNSEWDFATLTADFSLGEFEVRSITAYIDAFADNSLDLDFGPLRLIGQQRSEDHQQFTQEIIITSPNTGNFEYMAGLFYQKEDLRRTGDLEIFLSSLNPLFATNPLAPFLAAGLGDATIVRFSEQDSETLSAFAQAKWNLSERLTLTAGLRYSDDEKEFNKSLYVAAYDAVGYVPYSNPPRSLPHQAFYDQFLGFARAHNFGPNGFEVCPTVFPALPIPFAVETCATVPGFDNVRSEDHLTGDIVLQYDVNDDTMTYVKYGTGYKAGGFDEANNTGIVDTQEFEDETVESFEVGAKMTLWGGRARLNIAAFHNEFEDVQVSVFDGVANFVVRNAAATSTKGIEMDGQILFSDKLSARFALSYLDSQYDSYTGAACTAGQTAAFRGPGCSQDLSGSNTQFAPDFSGILGLEYLTPIGGDLEFKAGLDIQYMDDYQPTNDNDPVLIQDSFAKINARLQIAKADSWSLAILGKNLTDETISNAPNDIPLGNLGFLGSYFHFLDAPRSYEIQATYRF